VPTLETNGVTVNYSETGLSKDAGDTLALLHCSTSTHGQWRKLGDLLGDRYRLLAHDLLSYGGTSAYDGGDAGILEAEGDLVRALTDDLDGYHLLGHSYGGLIALRIALDAPDRLKSLTLIEPMAGFLMDEQEDAEPWAEIGDVADTYRAKLDADDVEDGMIYYFDYWNGAGAWAAQDQRMRDFALATAWKSYHEFGAIFDADNLVAPLDTLTMPIHIIRGAETRQSAWRISEKLADGLPAAQVTTIEGAGHLSPITHPDKVNGAVEGFLEGLEN